MTNDRGAGRRMVNRGSIVALGILCALATACGKGGKADVSAKLVAMGDGSGGSGTSGTGSGSGGTVGGTQSSSGGSVASGGSGALGGTGNTGTGGSMVGSAGTTMGMPGDQHPGGSVPDDSGLPYLPELTHVNATVRANSVNITFDPVPGAVDYRVYRLPNKSDIVLDSNGAFAGINNATYRCAGKRTAPVAEVDGDQGPKSDPIPDFIWVLTSVGPKNCASGEQCNGGYEASIGGYSGRTIDDATLGYAFQDPTPGTAPVYAVGDPAPEADNYADGARSKETRGKKYVVDNTAYLAAGWRDDGIAFYAPDSANSTACGDGTPVLVDGIEYDDGSGTSYAYYVAASTEGKARGTKNKPEQAFFLCSGSVGAAQPVMRVHYTRSSGSGHDELALGEERFKRIHCQASTFGQCADSPQSLWEVHFSNITEPTTLVVEALDAGCPFQGLMGPSAVKAGIVSEDDKSSPQLFTMDAVRSKATRGEVFMNGQWDSSSMPHPIARSAVKVEPEKLPAMDFASNFAGPAETFQQVNDGLDDCGLQKVFKAAGVKPDDPTCEDSTHQQSDTYDELDLTGITPSFGVVEGEMTAYNLSGWFHMAPRDKPANVSGDKYLYVVLDTSGFTTARRYPQILVSQQDFMTSEWLLNDSASTLSTDQATESWIQPVMILQPFSTLPPVLELELCNNRTWQVNNQCPAVRFETYDPVKSNSAAYGRGAQLTPRPALNDYMQPDRSARLELYVSSKKAYVLLEGQPYGCADLANITMTDPSGATIKPPPAAPTGTVTVAFGDVLYHPIVEDDKYQINSVFIDQKSLMGDVRHFDYFAYKSGVDQPAWDESRFPCMKQMHQGGAVAPESD